MISNPFFWVSLIALAVKIWCGHRLQKNWVNSPGMIVCFTFLILIYINTALELYGFYILEYPTNNILELMKLYYTIFLATLISIPVMITCFIENKFNQIAIGTGISLIIIMSYLTMGTDLILIDIVAHKYAYSRVGGQYYFIFQLISLTSMVMAVVVAYRGYRKANNELIKIRSFLLLAGYVPYILFVALVIITMHLGLSSSTVGFGPLFIALFMVAFAESLKTNYIFDLRAITPGTEKFKTLYKLNKPLVVVSTDEDTCKGLEKEFKNTLMDQAKLLFDTDTKSAAWLGMPKSTYSRLSKKH